MTVACVQAKFGRWLRSIHQHCVEGSAGASAAMSSADWAVVQDVAVTVAGLLSGGLETAETAGQSGAVPLA